MLKPKGEIYLFDHYNIYDYNVYVKYENLNLSKKVLQSGWNIFSIKFIKNFFKDKKVELFKFYMNKKIKKNKKDLIRTWTIRYKNKNFVTNALTFMLNHFCIRIS